MRTLDCLIRDNDAQAETTTHNKYEVREPRIFRSYARVHEKVTTNAHARTERQRTDLTTTHAYADVNIARTNPLQY